tara:strand:+ start:950 stop:1147 length:198 start_codon:yes stop_codon:yes gene_type:complete
MSRDWIAHNAYLKVERQRNKLEEVLQDLLAAIEEEGIDDQYPADHSLTTCLDRAQQLLDTEGSHA